MPQDQRGGESAARDTQTNGQGWLGLFHGWPWKLAAPRPKPSPESEKLERAYHRLLDSLKAAVEDFTTMEINSVLVQNISADRPLTDLELLRQAGEDLVNWLKEHPVDGRFQQPLSEQTLTRLEQLTESLDLPLDQPEAEGSQALYHEQEAIQALHTETASCLDNGGARLPSPPTTLLGRLSVVSVDYSLNPRETKDVTASCPAGKKAIAGGWDNPNGDNVAFDSRPTAENAWTVKVFNVTPTTGGSVGAGKVYAVCAS